MQAHRCSLWEVCVSAGQRGQRAGRGVSTHMDDDCAVRELSFQASHSACHSAITSRNTGRSSERPVDVVCGISHLQPALLIKCYTLPGPPGSLMLLSQMRRPRQPSTSPPGLGSGTQAFWIPDFLWSKSTKWDHQADLAVTHPDHSG